MIYNINEHEEMISILNGINSDLDEKKYTKILKRSEEYLRKYPDEILFYVLISIAYSEKGKLKEALKILKSAEERFHSHFEMFYQLAKVNEGLDNFEEAEKYYHKSIEATPDSVVQAKADCWNDLGALKFNLGYENEAREYFSRALEIDPDHKLAYENLYDTPGKSDTYEFLMQSYDLFEKIQIRKYLEKNNIKKFKSKKEKEKILTYIEREWTNKVSGKITTYESLTDTEKENYFNGIEIDYSKQVAEAGLPVFDDPEYALLRNKFSFLPENGISYVISVMPAIEHEDISLERISQIAEGSDITLKEIEIFKWAYEMGKKFVKLTDSKSEKEFLKLSAEILLIMRQRIHNEKESEEILVKIIEEMAGDE